MKYKDEIPKAPLSPYMLFMKSKQPKVKQKHPKLLMTEVAMILGERDVVSSENYEALGTVV